MFDGELGRSTNLGLWSWRLPSFLSIVAGARARQTNREREPHRSVACAS